MKTKEYTKNKDITIFWTPSKCAHAAVCVKTLPLVYHPKSNPWITPETATVEQLKAQIEQCPTGALEYRINEK